MDDRSAKAVRTAFERLYRADLAYRTEALVNWCPGCRTSVSDLEVVATPETGTLWSVRYHLIEPATGRPDPDAGIVVATTRPETILGDTAVAVHPDDPRYAALVGRMVRIPFVERDVPIIADAVVDPAFGTGAVKITPAHDPQDYATGLRHGLAAPTILADDIILPPVGYDVKCISMGFFVEDARAVIWRGPMLHKALHQFLTDFYWGDPDYLLIDMPPGTGDVALSMAQYLPKSEIYVVTTPQPAAQRVAQRSAAMAKEVHLPVRGVIENMSFFTGDDGKRYEIFGSGGGASLAAGLGVPLLAQIPLVPELREGGDVGVPVTIAEPHGDAAQAFERLAKEIDRLGPARVYRSELKIN